MKAKKIAKVATKWMKACEIHEACGFTGYVDSTRHFCDRMVRAGKLTRRKTKAKTSNQKLTEYRKC